MRNLSIILALLLLISCNSKTEKKESDTAKAITEEVKATPTIDKKVIENQKKKIPNVIQSNYETFESIYFSDIGLSKTTETELSIFKGLTDALMSYILIEYINEKHLDPYRKIKNPKDSITVSLSDQTFNFYRIYDSDITEYDLKRRDVGEGHRLHWSEEEKMSEEEIKEWNDEHQRRLDQIDTSLQNIKKSNRYIVKGSWHFDKKANDTLFLTINGKYYSVDAYHYSTYGENGPIYFDEFLDKINVDLFEIIHGLGQKKKFDETDLEIIDKQDLTYIRNQFYARKGYKFKTEKMQQFFGLKAWYEATSDDVTDEFNEIELYNIYFIKDIEDGKK